MWHGFEFSFEASGEVSELNCVSEASRKRDEVNPAATEETGVTRVKWNFAVTGRSGHYVRPQYTFRVGDQPFRDVTSCTSNGKEVLKFDFTITP
jgi:hypothetical protein